MQEADLSWGAAAANGSVHCALVLHRPLDLHAQLARRVERPVRIAQQLAREEHAVGPVLTDDAVRLSGFRDEADGTRRHVRLAANALRKSDLVARRHGNDGVRNGTDVNANASEALMNARRIDT